LAAVMAECDQLRARLAATTADRNELPEWFATAERDPLKRWSAAELRAERAEPKARRAPPESASSLLHEMSDESRTRLAGEGSAGIGRRLRRWLRAAELNLAWARHGVTPRVLRPFLVHNPLFDAKWYLDTYEDVKLRGVNPERHYRRHGVKEGRN